jgi:hypothetical protein
MNDVDELLAKSRELKGGLGAIAWATLEMLRRGGLDETEVEEVYRRIKKAFALPTNATCNAICEVVERRLHEERRPSGKWYGH